MRRLMEVKDNWEVLADSDIEYYSVYEDAIIPEKSLVTEFSTDYMDVIIGVVCCNSDIGYVDLRDIDNEGEDVYSIELYAEYDVDDSPFEGYSRMFTSFAHPYADQYVDVDDALKDANKLCSELLSSNPDDISDLARKKYGMEFLGSDLV